MGATIDRVQDDAPIMCSMCENQRVASLEFYTEQGRMIAQVYLCDEHVEDLEGAVEDYEDGLL